MASDFRSFGPIKFKILNIFFLIIKKRSSIPFGLGDFELISVGSLEDPSLELSIDVRLADGKSSNLSILSNLAAEDRSEGEVS